jgi:hypothetical protein
MLWRFSGQRELRHNPPTRRIPSMMVQPMACLSDRQWSPGARESFKQGQESGLTARRLGIEQKSTTSQEEK